MIKKGCILCLLMALKAFTVYGEHTRIRIESHRDFSILESFFRMGVREEGYGYVLDGVKPISIRDYYSIDQFPIAKDLKYSEQEFVNTLLVCGVIPIWKKLCLHQRKFVLKAVPLEDPDAVVPGWELQFINVLKLKEVIADNIDLFRYILGASVSVDDLVSRIAFSDESLIKILKNESTLIGIVLGFGTHNSVVGGRAETIHTLSFSWECPPLLPKSFLFQDQELLGCSELTPERYGAYYLALAGGDRSFFNDRPSHPHARQGLSNVKEELACINKLEEPLPINLTAQKPFFIFEAYQGERKNHGLFEKLKKAQKSSQTLLMEPSFLERFLEKVEGKKPIITCDSVSVKGAPFALLQNIVTTQQWVQVFQNIAKRLNDPNHYASFVTAFKTPSTSTRNPPEMMGASEAVLEGLKVARENLSKADRAFQTFSKDKSLEELSPQKLYSKTTLNGAGKKLENVCRARLGYVIEDLEGNTLYADYDTWIDLTEVIQGLSYGIQGMQVGEKRTVYIHPSLAYGALTTLPPCIGLVCKLHLQDIEENTSSSPPALVPIDLEWIRSTRYLQMVTRSLEQKPSFIGSFYRDMLEKLGNVDISQITLRLRKDKNREEKSTIIPIQNHQNSH